MAKEAPKMKQLVNKNLITLKCVLFCFLSGIGCIFPFLPLHMVDVGLELGEARLISAVAPCIALLGPAILGPLIDRLSVGRGSTGGQSGPSGSGRLLRIVTALCLILSALFYTLLLAVPYTQRYPVRRPTVLFLCDENGAYVQQEVCSEGMQCNRWEGQKSGVLAVGQCEYGCADPDMRWLLSAFAVPAPTTSTLSPMYLSAANFTPAPQNLEAENDNDDDADFEPNPPHLCYGGTCQVYMRHAGRMRVPLSLLAPLPPDNDTEQARWCTYRTDSPSHCYVPPERIPEQENCKPAVRCLVMDPYDEPDGVLADAECKKIEGDPVASFWAYFFIRILADIWPTAALALLGAACVIATREKSLGRGDVGRQLAFGTLGLAIFPPLAGLAADQMPDDKYLVPFVMHAVFMLLGALILLVDKNMPLSTPEWWWHTATGVLAMPMNVIRRYGAETAAIFAVVTLLGVLWSGIDAYLPWTLRDLLRLSYEQSVKDAEQIGDPLNVTGLSNVTYTHIGLTLTAGALPALPALFWAEALVDYIGHSNVFIAAFVCYALRYTFLAFSASYVYIEVCELGEVFTLSLVWVTAVLYFRHLIPRKYTVSGQALPVIAHFCIGRCIGAVVSGMVSLDSALESARDVYKALAIVSIVAAIIYLALYHLLLAPRCAAPAQPPPTQLLQACTVDGQLTAKGLNANGGAANGNYSPMRVYHEERSRKGHFRY